MEELKQLYPGLNFNECIGVSCPSGWNMLVHSMLKQMQIIPECCIDQIKEKFGGLRVYAHTNQIDYSERLEEILDIYTMRANSICVKCGKDKYMNICSNCGYT